MSSMCRFSLLSVCLFFSTSITAQTPLSQGFSYQGRYEENGFPVNGTVHLRFSLWDSSGEGLPPTGGNQIGAVQILTDVPVSDGVFTVTLNAGGEFGPNAFNGEARWLQIVVCGDPNCQSLTTLSPRQPITGTPYAVQASRAVTAPWTGLSGVPDGFADGVDNIGEITWEVSGTNIYRATGNVGIGTAIPQARLHLSGTDSRLLVEATDSDSESLAVTEYLRAGGNRWITGYGIHDEYFIREETPNGGTGAFLAMSAGKIGIQTPFPLAPLHIQGEPASSAGTPALVGNTHTFMSFYPDGPSNGRKAWFGFGGAETRDIALVNHSGNIIMEPSGSGDRFYVNSHLYIRSADFGDYHNLQWDGADGRVYYDDSTRRHKENIEPLEDDFDCLLEAQPKTYTRPGKPDRHEIGYIAEEIEELGLTHLLQYDKDGRPDGVNYEKAVLYLTEIAKSQRDRIVQQEARIDDLTERINRLEAISAFSGEKTSEDTR